VSQPNIQKKKISDVYPYTGGIGEPYNILPVFCLPPGSSIGNQQGDASSGSSNRKNMVSQMFFFISFTTRGSPADPIQQNYLFPVRTS
jgi:hypothetical protein